MTYDNTTADTNGTEVVELVWKPGDPITKYARSLFVGTYEEETCPGEEDGEKEEVRRNTESDNKYQGFSVNRCNVLIKIARA